MFQIIEPVVCQQLKGRSLSRIWLKILDLQELRGTVIKDPVQNWIGKCWEKKAEIINQRRRQKKETKQSVYKYLYEDAGEDALDNKFVC